MIWSNHLTPEQYDLVKLYLFTSNLFIQALNLLRLERLQFTSSIEFGRSIKTECCIPS